MDVCDENCGQYSIASPATNVEVARDLMIYFWMSVGRSVGGW
jgi:hypothetical protein